VQSVESAPTAPPAAVAGRSLLPAPVPDQRYTALLDRPAVSTRVFALASAVGVGTWTAAGLAGEPALTAAGWLCLPVAVAGAWSARRAAVVAGVASVLTATATWMDDAAGPGPLLLVLQAVFFLAVGQVVARLTRMVREADRRVVSALEDQRERALEAFAERDALSSRLAHQAMHDMLTGLPNRMLFLERLENALKHAGPDTAVGVLFIDLDDFKIVNDSLGHAAGDELLVGVGQRLANALRTGDMVARFGGDEFAVLLMHNGTADQAAGVAKRLLGVLRAPFALSAGMASGQASGGLVLDTRDPEKTVAEQAGDLMRQADLAMYAAKAAGGGACVEFLDEFQEEMLDRLALQDEITQALIHDDFKLHYQPVVDLPSRRVIAVEALVRWHHPERGNIPPSRFIPMAEQSGSIVQLGLWVLEQACLDLQLWDELCPDNDLRITVNVSARQLRESSVGPQIARVLHRTGIDPRRLVLEVTESLLMDDDDAAAATLWQLRGLGIRIAVDDFGTGYSSLSRLVDLPLDELKIDRAFVAELDRSDAGATIIKAAVAMAHGLDLTVVAEGVETEEQLDFLAGEGCDHAQGYLFSPPVPMDAITGMLRRGANLHAPRAAAVPDQRPVDVPRLPARPSPTIIPSMPRHR
jgi:diguanylate cyclase (GGDEF)-like protein